MIVYKYNDIRNTCPVLTVFVTWCRAGIFYSHLIILKQFSIIPITIMGYNAIIQ